MKTVAVSGGFDPLHVGHIRHFKAAKRLGDKLIVMLNSDRFLRKKKGYVFMPYKERAEIIKNIKYVDEVVPVIDEDESVAETLKWLMPDIFAKGGDRKMANIPKQEREVCNKYHIEMRFGIGGDKIQSSSRLVNNTKK